MGADFPQSPRPGSGAGRLAPLGLPSRMTRPGSAPYNSMSFFKGPDQPAIQDETHTMTFGEAIKTCFSKYADFNGRAPRSEYWWWTLFVLLASLAAGLINDKVGGLLSLATLLPGLAVSARRLHDTNRSGWFQLLMFIPLIGWIVLLVWMVQEGREPNRFG